MSLDSLERSLRARISGAVARNEPMARHTTYRIGGSAALFVTCETPDDVAETVRSCDEVGVPRVTIGKGSNLLVADAGFPGVVVTLGRGFGAHRVMDRMVEAGAACILAHVVRDAWGAGLSGMEFAVGVPGTVGGAIVMNAGTADAWIGAVTESVTVYVPGQGVLRLGSGEITWSYRSSSLPDGCVVVGTTLGLTPADRDGIRVAMDASLQRRKQTQPLGVPSAGSVFRNPPGESAGRLIESVGLKGARVGGARISEVHANFIVNDGNARAADVLGLVRKAQTTVRDTYGIELTPEIKLLGTFEDA